jgi:c-di-GMP-binding flagellar brake protein YcgR
VNAPDIRSRLENTGQLLVRSGIEIDRILGSIAESGDTVSAELPAQGMFLSRLVAVEPEKQAVLLAYSDDKAANSAVFSAKSLALRCNHRGAQFAFSCTKPRQAMHRQAPAIQFALPTHLLAMQQRREFPRLKVPAQADVECELRLGLQAFGARLADVGLDGMGFLVTDATIPLCEGTGLKGARIRHPRGEPVTVDIEVRHVARVMLPDGKRASRVGCRILTGPKELEELIRLFIIDLE